MDKEQARFILQSFRPDGADAKDPDFAGALAVAAEDRELGAWLASERAQDSAFAAALVDVEIPEDLRRNILGVLHGESPATEYEEMDATFVSALASVRPPDDLRDQILTAMKVEERNGESEKEAPRRVQNWLGVAAVAAMVVLGAFVALEVTNRKDEAVAGIERQVIEYDAIQLVSSEFKLDKMAQKPEQLFAYLESRGMPAPALEDLPKGLTGAAGIGCKMFKIDGKNAALICFDKKGVGTIHLVVIDRKAVEGKLPNLAGAKSGCWQCPVTEVSVAAWEGHDNALFLLGKVPQKELVSVF